MKQIYITPSIVIVSFDDCQLLTASTPEYNGLFNARELDNWEEAE